MKRIITLVAVLSIFACSPKIVAPTQADVERAVAKYPTATLAQLTQGHDLYVANCGMCHGLKNPKSESATAWPGIVEDMAGKVNKKAGAGTLDDAKKKNIEQYLVAMSSK
jgi:cytochrome c5